jgi:hypothetical protein
VKQYQIIPFGFDDIINQEVISKVILYFGKLLNFLKEILIKSKLFKGNYWWFRNWHKMLLLVILNIRNKSYFFILTKMNVSIQIIHYPR